jgi:hypothetical protein
VPIFRSFVWCFFYLNFPGHLFEAHETECAPVTLARPGLSDVYAQEGARVVTNLELDLNEVCVLTLAIRLLARRSTPSSSHTHLRILGTRRFCYRE